MTDPDGLLEVPFPFPGITPFGLDACAIQGQCFHPSGGVFLSSPMASTILAVGY